MNNTKMKTLVTGGAGFLGSHVARHCLALGHEVVVLDDLSGGFEDQVPVGATFVKGSITNAAAVAALFEAYKFDYVYHLAAYAAEGLSHFIRRFNYENNVLGSINLINESVKHDVRCFVFTSSMAVYGKGQVPFVESAVPAPEDPYGIAKLAIELDLALANKLFGLNYIIFRPHNIYGEHQNIGDRYRNVVGIFMNQIMQAQPLTIFGDGLQTRAFSYVDDVAPYIAQAVNVPGAYGRCINFGADQVYTVNELAAKVCEVFGVMLHAKYLPAREEVMHAWSAHTLANSLFHPTATDLHIGLQRMATWALEHGARQGQLREPEIHKNLPTIWCK